MVTIKQQHMDLLATMRMEAVQRMNEIGHRPGGMGALGVSRAGGVPFHLLEFSEEHRADWVLSFVAGRAVVTGEDVLGILGRLNSHLGALGEMERAGKSACMEGVEIGELAPDARDHLAPLAPTKLFAMGSLAEQLKLAVMGRIEALMRRGNTVEDIADRCGLAPWNVERLLDSQQHSSFVELEEVAPMLGLSLSINWRIKE